jgi:hypothetical protein
MDAMASLQIHLEVMAWRRMKGVLTTFGERLTLSLSSLARRTGGLLNEQIGQRT